MPSEIPTMASAGYRAAPPASTCSRCGGALDVERAVLSSEGLPLCARCNAEAQIAEAEDRWCQLQEEVAAE